MALYINNCVNVIIEFVYISHSPNATGVVMYNTNGINRITDCMFYNNSVAYSTESTPSSLQGGGGFYVEFSYVLPYW